MEERYPNCTAEINSHFPERRRTVKNLPGEDCSDESIDEPLRKFTVWVHNVIMDTLVDSIDRRFLLQNSSLFVDLSFLSPINFPCVIEGTPWRCTRSQRQNSRIQWKYDKKEFADWTGTLYCQLEQTELEHFALNWDRLKNSSNEEYSIFLEENCNVGEDFLEPVSSTCKSYRNCCLCCFQVLTSTNCLMKSTTH